MGADAAILSQQITPFTMENIKITLETLYDILRNEKKKEDLQKLESSFFFDVVAYLREKQALLELKREGENIFAAGEKEKLEYELRSIRRILKEIYEKREKKIIDIAMNRSRTGSDIIDTSSLLREEKEFYTLILQNLDIFRRGVLLNLFRAELPFVSGQLQRVEITFEQRKEQIKAELRQQQSEQNEETEEQKPVLQKVVMTKIRFTHAMPSFVWKDMKVYGPFDAGEETEIFPEVADLLVRKGRAEKL
ncbi:MAG TPA: hypothetical protein VJA18_05760 [Candidatus Nanoarchaeia archaeon]|nr:hypothetical protein [Candidatus Nanoarchaeia archaeon]